jgi:hypothetical protein
METTTVLPTEPGIYLFAGSRRGPADVRELVELPRVELVRVMRRSDGKLWYIGNDFFWEPEKAIGAWTKISDEAFQLQSVALDELVDAAARDLVPRVVSRGYGSDTDRLLEALIGPFAANPSLVSMASRIFGRAITLGVVVLETGVQMGMSRWVLAEKPKPR